MRHSAFSLLANALTGQRGWTPMWREPEAKPAYDVVVGGGGGHGLATAYYLAKEYGITNVAVVEKGYLGNGNVGRNTTIIRSNYLLPGKHPVLRIIAVISWLRVIDGLAIQIERCLLSDVSPIVTLV